MSTDIKIGIELELVGKTEKTIQEMNKFSDTLREVQKLTGRLSPLFQATSRDILRVGTATLDITGLLEKFKWTGQITEEQLKEMQDATKKLNATMALENAVLRKAEHEWTMFRSRVQDAAAAAIPSASAIHSLAQEIQGLVADGKETNRVYQELARGFSRTGPTISVPFIKALEGVTGSIGQVIIDIPQLQQALQTLPPELNALVEAYRRGRLEGAEEFIQSQQRVREELWKISQVNRITAATLGATNMAWRQLGRTIFWSGLGIMFAYMSFSRMARMALSVKSAQLGLLRAQMNYNDALQRVNQLRQFGITYGRAWQEANLDLLESTHGLRLAEDRVRSAVWQRMMAQLQFVYGVVPTIIRTYGDMQASIVQLVVAKWMDTTATGAQSVAELTHQASEAAAIAMGELHTAVLLKKAAALAMVTFGLNIAIGALANWYAQMQAKERIAEMNAELQKLNVTMTRPGSPALYESFAVMANNMDKAYTSAKKLTELRLLTYRGQGGGGMPLGGDIKGGITINIYGPWYVTEPGASKKVATDIVRKLRNRGAPI